MRAIFIIMLALCVLFQVGVLAGKHSKDDDDKAGDRANDDDGSKDDGSQDDGSHDDSSKKHHHHHDDDDATVCSDTIKTCASDLTVVMEKLEAVRAEIEGFKGEDGFLAAYALHNREREVEDLIHKARYDCCAIPRQLDEEETKFLLALEDPLTFEIKQILNALMHKKPELEKVSLATSVLRNDLRTIQALVRPVGSCLVEKVCDDKKSAAKQAVAELDSLFSSAINAC